MGVKGKARDGCGQMTVEWAVAFPVFIVVAVIAVNALLFFGECAEFDRAARNAVRTHVAVPAYGESLEQSRASVQAALDSAMDAPYLSSDVVLEGGAAGTVRCTATLRFSPTLFGLGLRSEVFGVALPQLEHRVELAVDRYKPGVLF